MNILIKDYIIPQEPKIAKRISIQVFEINFGVSVSVRVIMYNSPNLDHMSYCDIKTLKIEGDEYNNWGNDDNYLIDLVLSKLGIEKIDLPEINSILNTGLEVSNNNLSSENSNIN